MSTVLLVYGNDLVCLCLDNHHEQASEHPDGWSDCKGLPYIQCLTDLAGTIGFAYKWSV